MGPIHPPILTPTPIIPKSFHHALEPCDAWRLRRRCSGHTSAEGATRLDGPRWTEGELCFKVSVRTFCVLIDPLKYGAET